MRKLFLILGLACSLSAFAQTHVADYSNTTSSGTSLAVSYTIPGGCPGSNCAVIVSFALQRYPISGTASIAGSGSGCPTFGPQFVGSPGDLLVVFATGVSAGSCTATLTWTGSALALTGAVSVYTGVGAAVPFETQDANGFTSSASSVSLTAVTAGTSDLVYSALYSTCTTGTPSGSGSNNLRTTVTNSGNNKLTVWDQTVGPGPTTNAMSYGCSASYSSAVMIALRSVDPTFGWMQSNCGTSTGTTINPSFLWTSTLNAHDAVLLAISPLSQGDTGWSYMPLVSDDTVDTLKGLPIGHRANTNLYYLFPDVTGGSRTWTVTDNNGMSQTYKWCITQFRGTGNVYPVSGAYYTGTGGGVTSYSVTGATLPVGNYILYSDVYSTESCSQTAARPSGWSMSYWGQWENCSSTLYYRNIFTQQVTASAATLSTTITSTTQNGFPGGNWALGDASSVIAFAAVDNVNPRAVQVSTGGGTVGITGTSLQSTVPVQAGQIGILAASANCSGGTGPSGTVAGTWTLQLGGLGSHDSAVWTITYTGSGYDQITVNGTCNMAANYLVLDGFAGIDQKNYQDCGATMGPCSDGGVTLASPGDLVESFGFVNDQPISVTSNNTSFLQRNYASSHQAEAPGYELINAPASTISNSYTLGSSATIAAGIISFIPAVTPAKGTVLSTGVVVSAGSTVQ